MNPITCYASDREVKTTLYRDGVALTLGEVVAAFNDLVREAEARREILDAVTSAAGEGNCRISAATIDWRQRLRDFAEDSEQHSISREEWQENRRTFPGLVLYLVNGFFAAYYDDAAKVWGQADDTRPMFHVMVQSDPPHRTVIHPLHLNDWVEHFAEICLPVSIIKVAE